MKDRYYFAYGSNMNLEQMKYRCPAAEVVENVRLENYRLAFREGLRAMG
ncbi:MAG: gamma-glutamylcyclotransferase family protein [Coprococcus sp.]